ncbi:uncharacterized protein LOC119229147 [Pungitius pungitius]|uniref:uncharacterized protein LOC119229147 n=1 Tax=Pungitius pungitius TaxID=134920 RepID=UPI002E150424
MTSVTKRFPNVFVLDFPPRLNCEVKDQDLLRQEFRDVTARMSVKYCSIAEYFPLQDRKLWVRDGDEVKDCSVPLTPARSSLVPLVKMDDTTPLNVPSPKECTPVPPHITEVDTSPTSTEVTARPQPTRVSVAVKKEVQAAPGAEETAGSSSTGVPKEAASVKVQTSPTFAEVAAQYPLFITTNTWCLLIVGHVMHLDWHLVLAHLWLSSTAVFMT